MADAAEQIQDDIRVECAETSPVIRSVSVEVDADRVKRAFDRAYRELGRSARVKGFRPGKVPRSVLERMYGAGMPEEIQRALVSETLAVAIEQAKVTPVSEPDIDAEPPQPGQAYRYTAIVEVKPEFVLPDVSGVTGQRPIVSVADEEVDAELDRIREHHVKLVEEPEGTEAVDDHVLTLDFEGRIDGELFQGGAAKGADLRLGAGTMVPGFEDQLLGARAGDDRQVTVTFPDDYGPAELNGKEAVFDCHVVAVRRRELPELDDELAKDAGEFETLDELREKIVADRRKQQDDAADRALNESLIESLIALTDFEVPPGVVERQLQSQMRQLHEQFQGRVPDEVIHQQLRRMQEDGRPVAERRVREALLIEKIVAEQDLAAADEEVDGRLQDMADAQGMDVATLRPMAEQQGWLQAIEHEVVEQKAYAWLAEQATVEDVDPAAAAAAEAIAQVQAEAKAQAQAESGEDDASA